MASSTAALPVSVRKNLRSGVCKFRAHAVRPDKGGAAGSCPSSGTAFSLVGELAAVKSRRPGFPAHLIMSITPARRPAKKPPGAAR
jgi:hypothetical protein